MWSWIETLLRSLVEGLDAFGPARAAGEAALSLEGRVAGAFLVALGAGLWFGRRFISFMTRLEVGERTEKTHSPGLEKLHRSKAGTPTMGGLFILASVLLAALLFARWEEPWTLLAAGGLLAFGLLGLRDDFVKWKGDRTRHGLRLWTKLFLQVGLGAGLAVGAFFALAPAAARDPAVGGLRVPFVGTFDASAILFGSALFIPLAIAVIVGASNGVNLTDGLDGLAGGCVAMASFVLLTFAFLEAKPAWAAALGLPAVPGAGEIAVLSAAVLAATLAFLRYNLHPAQVFMGDVGSLPLGAFLGIAALALRQELLLALVGGVFVVESFSVLLQIFSFRVFGRRIFRIAPLHHHFQFQGHSETAVTRGFWIAAAGLGVLGIAALGV